MKIPAVACRLTLGLGSLNGAMDLLAPTVRLIWSEGPQLSDWVGICADLIASLSSMVV